MIENDDTQPEPNYTRDKAIHIAVIVVCALLIALAFISPQMRASFFWGLDVIAFNARVWWEGLIALLS